MKQLVATALRIALSDSPVLLTGESGTGKEVFAHYLFENSPRHDKPFVPINMGAIPETMIESELFGHEKGAFTGAITQKKGLVELADQGTLFLDEIGDMPLPLQVKLLRFLETGEFRRVGGNTLRRVNVRIIAATNAELEQKVHDGQFRSDLYYRLKVVDMIIPPLRNRKEDILPLAYFFLDRYKRSNAAKTLTEEVKRYLLNYSYPGNVRELGHMIERGTILSLNEQIGVTDIFQFPPQMTDVQPERSPSPLQDGGTEVISLKEMEKSHISKILLQSDWNKTKAADLLGISVRNLYRKIEEYGLRP
jgi:two-component system NtrC family response regulator/two-component system response regulator AtoC